MMFLLLVHGGLTVSRQAFNYLTLLLYSPTLTMIRRRHLDILHDVIT
jgi:hypothetical protein